MSTVEATGLTKFQATAISMAQCGYDTWRRSGPLGS